MATDLQQQIRTLKANPAEIQRLQCDALEEALEGKYDLVEPSNPFMQLMSLNAVVGSASMMETESVTRKLYPLLAASYDDLYRHMSDSDYLNRFSTPSSTSLMMLFPKDELIKKSIYDVELGLSHLIIPKHTQFNISGYKFGIKFPIELQVLPNKTIQIIYDTSIETPFTKPATNILDWELVTFPSEMGDIEFIKLTIPVEQFELTSHSLTINNSTSNSNIVNYSDDFHYCRVYHKHNTVDWVEIKTTHSDQVYDKNTPTAVLKVLDNTLKVTIPQIYYSTDLIGSTLRVDVYTTKGPIELLLSNYKTEEFQVLFEDYDSETVSRYVAPITTFNTLMIASTDVTVGGSKGISVEQLRENVIDDSSNDAVPITSHQIDTTLRTRGYNVVLDLDNVSDRTYHVTRLLPAPVNTNVSNTIGTLTQQIQLNETILRDMENVYLNFDRITISPDNLYIHENGVLKMLGDVERVAIEQAPKTELIRSLNQKEYLYTPFHYVLDSSSDTFKVRAYYLDKPEITSKSHLGRNVHVQQAISAEYVTVEKVVDGYKLSIVLPEENSTPEILKDLTIQLGFIPTKEQVHVYKNAEHVGYLEGTKAVFELLVKTDYDVDDEDLLSITNFKMYTDDIQVYFTDLVTEFKLFYVLENTKLPLNELTEMDRLAGDIFLSGHYVVTTLESIKLEFGKALHGLELSSRTVLSNIEYKTYQEDVPWTYEEDVYETDENGLKTFEVVEGKVAFNILHAKGNVQLDDNGDPLIKHRQGDFIRNASGELIPQNDRHINRLITMTLFDARYKFCTDISLLKYRDYLFQSIIAYLENDIQFISDKLLERTALYFHPRKTMGEVEVTVESGEVINIPTKQDFVVTYHLTDVGYDDPVLKNNITLNTNDVIALALTERTITTNAINEKLKATMGSEVISVNIDGLGPDNTMDMYTIVDGSASSSVDVRMVLLPNDTITIEDKIDVKFVRHSR